MISGVSVLHGHGPYHLPKGLNVSFACSALIASRNSSVSYSWSCLGPGVRWKIGGSQLNRLMSGYDARIAMASSLIVGLDGRRCVG